MGLLISLLVAEKSGFHLADQGTPEALKQFADKMTAQAMEAMQDLGTTSTALASTSEASAHNGAAETVKP
jgi:hypothetical protein